MKITIKAEGVTIVAEGEGDDGLMLRNVFCEMLEKAANPAYSVTGDNSIREDLDFRPGQPWGKP